MRAHFCIGIIGSLWALPGWGIGYMYTGVGGDGRELMEITSVEVDVDIQDRLAVTRIEQVFTNRSDRQVEGVYEFVLPVGAVITDLVLWIGDRRVAGGRCRRDGIGNRRTFLVEEIRRDAVAKVVSDLDLFAEV